MQNSGDKEQETEPFWRRKRLEDMTHTEWEQLCDGCGRCCMLKLEDEDTEEVFLTRVSCKLLDIGKCSCTDYRRRHERVPDCLELSPAMVRELKWLPDTCAYRLIDSRQDLAWWHPLVSGDPATVHEAGISVRDWALTETPLRNAELHKYLVLDEE